MSNLPNSVADTAISRMFVSERAAGNAVPMSLAGGEHLFDMGDQADAIFFLRAGRLAAVQRLEGEEPRFLGVIRPGEPAGEMALIAGQPHGATVVALRDSEVIALPREAFFTAVEHDPAVLIELSRLMIARARSSSIIAPAGEPTVFGIVSAQKVVAVRAMAEEIADAIEAMGYNAVVVGPEALSAPTEWFSEVEATHDFVLYAAEYEELAWRQLVGRQVDRLFFVGNGHMPPPKKTETYASEPLTRQHLVDLILLQRPDCEQPKGSAAWLDAISVTRLLHVRQGWHDDIQRIARIITGQSVGLVLSGGGARAYAHVGAVKALRETGTPVDFVCGASMGAIVAAGVGNLWSDKEMDSRIRAAFVESSPLADIALPLIAMTRGDMVKERLKEHFGELMIEDLWLPFFCVSSNLTSGAYQVHKRGLLRHALRATISLPGVMPPVIDGEDVLVDGAVMKNFPADIMHAVHQGPVVGVDVSRGRSITAEDVRARSIWRWIFSGDWKRGPPIVSLLMRAATVTTARNMQADHDATDLLVAPRLDGVEIRNWKAYEPAVEAGYHAMKDALAKLPGPVSLMRRRPSKAERQRA